MNDPYLILGVPDDADDAAVERAYLAAIRLSPPDHHPERFQRLRAAYEKIRTRRDRLAYALFDKAPPTGADILARAAPVTEPRRPKPATLAALLRGEG
jgi:curved DNA-binding protein CbpA